MCDAHKKLLYAMRIKQPHNFEVLNVQSKLNY